MAKEDKGSEKKSGILVRDKEYVKFIQQLREAERKGRIDGGHKCPLCGMRYNTKEEADDCCTLTI